MDKPDREEKAIRFGCGALFGLVTGGLTLLRSADLFGPHWWWMALAGVVIFCGWAAMKAGDEFWRTALDKWWWWG